MNLKGSPSSLSLVTFPRFSNVTTKEPDLTSVDKFKRLSADLLKVLPGVVETLPQISWCQRCHGLAI